MQRKRFSNGIGNLIKAQGGVAVNRVGRFLECNCAGLKISTTVKKSGTSYMCIIMIVFVAYSCLRTPKSRLSLNKKTKQPVSRCFCFTDSCMV